MSKYNHKQEGAPEAESTANYSERIREFVKNNPDYMELVKSRLAVVERAVPVLQGVAGIVNDKTPGTVTVDAAVTGIKSGPNYPTNSEEYARHCVNMALLAGEAKSQEDLRLAA